VTPSYTPDSRRSFKASSHFHEEQTVYALKVHSRVHCMHRVHDLCTLSAYTACTCMHNTCAHCMHRSCTSERSVQSVQKVHAQCMQSACTVHSCNARSVKDLYKNALVQSVHALLCTAQWDLCTDLARVQRSSCKKAFAQTESAHYAQQNLVRNCNK